VFVLGEVMVQGKPAADRSKGSLSTNAAWAVAGNISYGAGRLLIFVILAKAFDQEQVGQFVLSLAIVTPLSFLLNMELRLVLVTDTKGLVDVGYCLAVRLVSNAVLALVLLGFCEVMRNGWGWDGDKIALMLLVGGVRMVESMADLYLGVLQKHERMKNVAISQTLKTLAVLLCAALAAQWSDDIWPVVAGWLLAVLLVGWYYDRRCAWRHQPVGIHWSSGVSKDLVKLAFPLGIFVTITSFNDGVGRYFVGYFMGDAVVAYLAAMLFVVTGAAAVQNGVNQSVLPRLAVYYASNIDAFWKLLRRVLALSWLAMAGLLAVVWWQGKLIVRIISRTEYVDYLYAPEQVKDVPLFVLVIFAGCVLLTGMIVGSALMACHRFKSNLAAVALGLAVNVIICWLYVGDYGVRAAAWAGIFSAGITTLVCTIVLVWVVPKPARQIDLK